MVKSLNIPFFIFLVVHSTFGQAMPAPIHGRMNKTIVIPLLKSPGDTLISRTPSTANASPVLQDSANNAHSPKKAGLLSAVLPGLGQAYNKKYWKIPIAYGGLTAATMAFVFNFKHYKTYRDAYRLTFSGQKSTNADINTALQLYSSQDLKTLRDGYRQYVDYSVLAFMGVYFLNILDAVVDAHMYNFDVSGNLSFHLSPVTHENYAGIGIIFDLDRNYAEGEKIF
ncbi:MAG: DUF5683 domain-containing protein [Chitinophagaceae bacterium]